MNSTGLDVSNSDFVANSTSGINDKPLSNGGDGALVIFMDNDIFQSTQGTKEDLPITKDLNFNVGFSSNLDSRVSTDQLGCGEISTKFEGHGVYEQAALIKENPLAPTAPKDNDQIQFNLETRVTTDLVGSEGVLARFEGNDGYQHAIKIQEELRGPKGANVNDANEFILNSMVLDGNSFPNSTVAGQEVHATIVGPRDNLNNATIAINSLMNLDNPNSDENNLGNRRSMLRSQVSNQLEAADAMNMSETHKELQGRNTKDSASLASKVPNSTFVNKPINANMNKSWNLLKSGNMTSNVIDHAKTSMNEKILT